MRTGRGTPCFWIFVFFPIISACFLMISGCSGPSEKTGVIHIEGNPEIALEEGDFTTAIGIWTQKVKESPEDASLNYKLGCAFYWMGEALAQDENLGGDPMSAFLDASHYLKKASILSPDHPDAGLMLVKALYMSNAIQESQDLLQDYLKKHPRVGPAYDLAGQINLTFSRQAPPEEEAEFLEKAMECFKRATELDPVLDAAYVHLGDCYMRKGENFLALETYKQGIRACPSVSEVHERLLYLYGADDGIDSREALSFYDQLLNEKNPEKTAEAQGLLWWFKGTWSDYKGGDHYRNEEYDLARKAFQDHIICLKNCLTFCPEYKESAETIEASALMNCGWCSLNLERFEEAEKGFFSALSLLSSQGIDPGENSNLVLAMDSLGFAIAQKQGLKAALGFFERLTNLWDKRHEWWNNYGFFSLEVNSRSDNPTTRIDAIYDGSGEKYEETLRIFQKALELKPDYPRYMNDVAMLIDYYLDPKGERKAETEAMYRKAWLMGKKAYESPFTDEKEKEIMFSAYTDALVNLGRMYLIQKRKEDCRGVLDQLLAVAPQRQETLMLNIRYSKVFEEISTEER